MRIKERIKEIYDVELNGLIEELKSKTKEERMVIHMTHSHSLFPMSKRFINLEELLNENVKVNMGKRKLVCGKYITY